ncbi:hypothetical protein GDO86_012510 [Hymenochirus boettgeri]|uniref:Uncharacterized protein n=1 Tax=Hymenochirus boettgeri TaxID=247094 RepID=A0A8T2IQB1_9PIPI|nr:hypothetical protein GDO86_012510 [Hymenochirus boettgeri]
MPFLPQGQLCENLGMSLKQGARVISTILSNAYSCFFQSQMEDSHANGICSNVPQTSESFQPSVSAFKDLISPSLGDEKTSDLNNLEGREFLSWVDFRTFFDRWCERNMFLFKIRCYTPLSRGSSHSNKNTSAIKYNYVQLVCKYSINQHATRSSSGEPPVPCQASIVVQAGPSHKCLLITHAKLDHNHRIAEEEFDHLFPRYMLKAKPFLFLEMTNTISKQFLMLKDLQDLVSQSSDEEPALRDLLEELTLTFSKDPKVKMKLVFCPDIAEVEGIFLMTSAMKSLLERFPSVIYINQSMSINDEFHLYTAICEDADNRGRACAYFISRKESLTPVRFMVVSLMQSVSDLIKPLIKTVILHASLEEVVLVQSLLPKRTVIMSQACALQILHSKIEMEEHSVQDKIKNIVSNLALSSTPEIYKHNLKTLKVTIKTSFLHFFLNYWHLRKETWVACWGLQEPQRIRFVNHIRTHLQSLQSTVCLNTSLSSCVNALLKLQSGLPNTNKCLGGC